VLDVDVPSMLMKHSPIKEGNEFTKLRYTAVTCNPDEFVLDKYTLRQRLYEQPRKTELFIVVTMYNEDDVLFCRTMRGVMQNIAHLCGRSRSKTWGKDGWKKVVVCIVSDGRMKINKRTQSVLAALGVYQDGVAKNVVNNKPVTAHLYEYTTQLWIDNKGRVGPGNGDAVPVQLIFCLKEKNQKKINSHRWFFNAFGDCLRPNVCVLLDVGTQPGPDSIYHLWKAFEVNQSIGGACGEIVALKGTMGKNLLNPLVAAQNFEYKMSNILDKPLESAFGYITVLPGAFSAYRYIALQNDDNGEGPLEKYFYGEKMHDANAGIFKANMYLAEDRILCWELVSKRSSRWTLHYVKSAYAITDVPDTVPELVSQRRRWLNGSFFAAVHSIAHFHYLYRSSHSVMRMFWLHIELVYQIISNVFAWFSLGNYYIAFVVLSKSMEYAVDLAPGEPAFDEFGNRKTNKIFEYINIPLGYGYLALLLLCFLLSLGNRPAGSKWGYTISMIGFALITIYMVFAAVWLTVEGVQKITQDKQEVGELIKDPTFRNIVLSLLATYGLYIVSSLMALDPWHMGKSCRSAHHSLQSRPSSSISYSRRRTSTSSTSMRSRTCTMSRGVPRAQTRCPRTSVSSSHQAATAR
jgi:chitin synthase